MNILSSDSFQYKGQKLITQNLQPHPPPDTDSRQTDRQNGLNENMCMLGIYL